MVHFVVTFFKFAYSGFFKCKYCFKKEKKKRITKKRIEKK